MRNYMSYQDLLVAPLPLLPPPPEITLVEATEVTVGTCSIEVTTTGINGTVWVIIQPNTAPAPTIAQIKAGLNGSGAAALWAGSTLVDSIDVYDVAGGPTGLPDAYQAYAVHEDKAGNPSLVAASAVIVGALDILGLFDTTYVGFWYDMSNADLLLSTASEQPAPAIGTGLLAQCRILLDLVGLNGMSLQAAGDAQTAFPVTAWGNNGFDTFTTSGDDFEGIKSTASGTDYANGTTGLSIALHKIYRLNTQVDTLTTPSTVCSVGLGSGTNARSLNVTLLTAGAKQVYVVCTTAQAGAHFNHVRGSAVGTTAASSASVRLLPGIPAYTTLTTGDAQAPLRTTDVSLKGDGVNESLITGHFASATVNSLVVRAKVPSTLAGMQAMLGTVGSGSTVRLFLGFNTAGNLVGGVGALGETVVKDAGDYRGLTKTFALTHDAANWFLYVDGVQVATGAASGAPNTTLTLRLFALNNNSGVANFFGGDIYQSLAIRRLLTPTEIAQIANQWNDV